MAHRLKSEETAQRKDQAPERRGSGNREIAPEPLPGMCEDTRLSRPGNAVRRARLLLARQREQGNASVVRASIASSGYSQRADEGQPLALQKVPGPGSPRSSLPGYHPQPFAHIRLEGPSLQRDSDLPSSNRLPEEAVQELEREMGRGRPLEPAVAATMSDYLGADFRDVRIHTGPEADRLSRRVSARAFTVGRDIFFGEGGFRLETLEGQRLLLHELVHVAQQGGQTPIGKELEVEPAESPLEQEAEQVAEAVATSGLAPNQAFGRGAVQRRVDWEVPGAPQAPPAPQAPGASEEQVREIVAIQDFGTLSEGERFEKLEILLAAQSGAPAVYRIWDSFGDTLPQVAARHADAWERSVRLCSNLDELPAVNRIKQQFERDVKGLARRYLETNRRYVTQEMERLGVARTTRQVVVSRRYGEEFTRSEQVATTTGTMTPEQAGYLEQIMGVAREVKRAQEYEQALRRIPVGYRVTWRRAGGDYWETLETSTFNPDAPPQRPPLGTEQPPMQSWESVKGQYDRIQAVISGFGNRFPAIYAAIRDDRIGELVRSTPEQARMVLANSLVAVLNNIDATAPRIEGGGLDYRDLQPIHVQLFGGARGPSGTDWTNPVNRWAANDILADHAAREFWISLGLSSLAAAAFLVAELATLGSATFFIAAGVGGAASLTQAGRSWSRYADLATAARSNISDEMALVAQGQVNEALISAVLDTVGVFLDAAGVAAHGVRALRTVLPEFALAGARKAAIEGLERLGQMGATEARSLLSRAVSELGVEETARRSGKSLDELMEIAGRDTDLGQRIEAWKLAKEGGLVGAEDLATRLRNLDQELRPGPTGPARLTRAEADRLVVQAIEQYGPVQTLRLAGGWKKLAGALGDDAVAGRHLYAWREQVWLDTEEFVVGELGGDVSRTGSQGLFSNDLDFSLLGPNASVNRDRARSFMAGRAGVSPEELEGLLACSIFTDPRRLHIYDVLPEALRRQIAEESAQLERSLIWNRRLYEARRTGNEALVEQIRAQMRELNVTESAFQPLSREDLTRLYSEVDSLHLELESAIQQGDVARQQDLVRRIGRTQAQINATEEGAYISAGGVREFVSERPGETIPRLAPGAPRLTSEQINAVLDQLPMLDHAAAGLVITNSLDNVADAIKGVGKYGERLSTVASQLRVPGRDLSVFEGLAERCRDLLARARAQTTVTLQQQLRADLDGVLREVRGLLADLESNSNALLRVLNEQGMMPGVENLNRIQLLTRAHAKYLRARDAIIWQLSVAVRAGAAAWASTSSPASAETRGEGR